MTKELNSLEARVEGDQGEGDQSEAFVEFLSSMKKSRESLKHMRILWFSDSEVRPVNYQLFNSLKILCLDFSSLLPFRDGIGKHLPSNPMTIYISYYCVNDSEPQVTDLGEELLLVKLLTTREPPNLKTVGVPMGRWDTNHEEVLSFRSKKLWEKRWKELKELEMFTSGRALLQLLKPRKNRE